MSRCVCSLFSRKSVSMAALGAMLLLQACSPTPTLAPTVTPTILPTEEPVATMVPEVIFGVAQVDTVDVLLLESWPLQANVLVRGMLQDGCTSLDEIRTERTESGFDISITTERPSDMICTQALVPFEESVSLDILGLTAGSYVVTVNGIKAGFTLQVDNVSVDVDAPAMTRVETAAGISAFVPDYWKQVDEDTWLSLDDVTLSFSLLESPSLNDAEALVVGDAEVLSRLPATLAWGDGVLYMLADSETSEREYDVICDIDDKQLLISLVAPDRTLLESNLVLFESVYSSAQILGNDAEYEVGSAPIESIEIETTQSVPVEATAIVKGYLPDGCTEIDSVTTTYDAPTRTFHVSITTVRPVNEMCTQAIEPYEQRVPLQVYGLLADEYTVEVNGATDRFELLRDNRSYPAAVSEEGMVSVRLPEPSLLMLVADDWKQVATGWVAPDGTVVGVERRELDEGEALLDVLPSGGCVVSYATPNLGWSGALACRLTVGDQVEEHVLVVLRDDSILDLYRRAPTEEQLESTTDLFNRMCESIEIEP